MRITIAASETSVVKRLSIADVRHQLKGSVERFNDPFEPLIPSEDWEMLK